MKIFTSDKDGEYQQWWRNYLNSIGMFNRKYKSNSEVVEHINLRLSEHSLRLTKVGKILLTYVIEGEEKDVTFFLLKWL